MHLLVAAALAVCAACGGSQVSSLGESQSELTSNSGNGRYLVVFKSDTLPSNAAAVVKAAGGSVDRTLSPIGVVTVSAGAGFRDAMAKNSSVLAVGQERFHSLPQSTVTEVSAAEAGPTASDTLYKKYGWDMRRINAPAVWSALPLAMFRLPNVWVTPAPAVARLLMIVES